MMGENIIKLTYSMTISEKSWLQYGGSAEWDQQIMLLRIVAHNGSLSDY